MSATLVVALPTTSSSTKKTRAKAQPRKRYGECCRRACTCRAPPPERRGLCGRAKQSLGSGRDCPPRRMPASVVRRRRPEALPRPRQGSTARRGRARSRGRGRWWRACSAWRAWSRGAGAGWGRNVPSETCRIRPIEASTGSPGCTGRGGPGAVALRGGGARGGPHRRKGSGRGREGPRDGRSDSVRRPQGRMPRRVRAQRHLAATAAPLRTRCRRRDRRSPRQRRRQRSSPRGAPRGELQPRRRPHCTSRRKPPPRRPHPRACAHRGGTRAGAALEAWPSPRTPPAHCQPR